MMKRIIVSFTCFLQDEHKNMTVRHIDVHDDKTIYARSNDIDGETRYKEYTIAEFEVIFKVNMGEFLTTKDIKKFK